MSPRPSIKGLASSIPLPHLRHLRQRHCHLRIATCDHQRALMRKIKSSNLSRKEGARQEGDREDGATLPNPATRLRQKAHQEAGLIQSVMASKLRARVEGQMTGATTGLSPLPRTWIFPELGIAACMASSYPICPGDSSMNILRTSLINDILMENWQIPHSALSLPLPKMLSMLKGVPSQTSWVKVLLVVQPIQAEKACPPLCWAEGRGA